MRIKNFLCPMPAACLALLLALTACGGGGSGGGNPPGGGGTAPPDVTPDTFGFTPLEGAVPGFSYESEAVTVAGVDAGEKATVTVSGGEYAIGDGPFTSEPGEISNGETVRVRVTAAGAFETAARATLDIGGVTADFAVATGKSSFAMEVGNGTLSFSWSPFSGVTHYRLLENPDGSSGFTPVVEDISGDAGAFTHRIPVHLTRWEDARFLLEACNENSCAALPQHKVTLEQPNSVQAVERFEMSEPPFQSALFGNAVAVSGDGLTLAISSDSTSRLASASEIQDGFVDVLVQTEGGRWQHHAKLDVAGDNSRDAFGASLALSQDGSVLAVGMPGDGDESGSVRLYTRGADEWSSMTITPGASASGDRFGFAVALNSAGTHLAVSAPREDSGGVNSGAVYLFAFDEASGEWTQDAFIKASDVDNGDEFGQSIAFVDGALLVGAPLEDSAATGVNGSKADDCHVATPVNCASDAGAAYLFMEGDGAWTQVAYLKASNTEAGDKFGSSVALPENLLYLAIGASAEDGRIGGINTPGAEHDNGLPKTGATYVFESAGEAWSQVAYIKMPNPTGVAFFGNAMAASADGHILAVAAYAEGRWDENDPLAAKGVYSRDLAQQEGASLSGAVLLYERSVDGQWSERSLVKAPAPRDRDRFAKSLAISADGRVLVVGAPEEDNESDGGTILNNVGAAYVY